MSLENCENNVSTPIFQANYPLTRTSLWGPALRSRRSLARVLHRGHALALRQNAAAQDRHAGRGDERAAGWQGVWV